MKGTREEGSWMGVERGVELEWRGTGRILLGKGARG